MSLHRNLRMKEDPMGPWYDNAHDPAFTRQYEAGLLASDRPDLDGRGADTETVSRQLISTALVLVLFVGAGWIATSDEPPVQSSSIPHDHEQ